MGLDIRLSKVPEALDLSVSLLCEFHKSTTLLAEVRSRDSLEA
jgi:hypothetical protein